MKKIVKIALTGAPSSGKTIILPRIREHFEKLGFNVILVNESATIVINNGIKKGTTLNFELEVAKNQLVIEAEADEKAKELDGDTIIIYDRGLTDCFSYITDEEKITLQDKIGINIIDSWSRYDAVLFLETAGFKNCYVNNEIRDESKDEALKLHDELLSVYVGHHHLRYIEAQDDLETKAQNVLYEIEDILNDVEYEKKYLIEYPNMTEALKYKPCKSEIEQIYLLSDIGSHRIRKRITNSITTYYETLKIRISGDKSTEIESIIDQEKYEQLKKNADPNMRPIIKDRYYFLYEGQYFEMDIFPFWSDKAFLELELNSVKQSREIKLPPFIKLIEDVSTKKEYKNAYLARK